MSTETINLTPDLLHYLQSRLREAPILQKLRSATKPLAGARMQISPEQGQLMALLVELLAAKKTLDIGTFTGYSALVVALVLPEEGRVISCDVSEEATNMAREFWQEAGVANKIDLRLNPALTTLQKLIAEGQAGTFDFSFIDADKGNYDAYYEASLTLLRKGGLIVIDNVLWSGRVIESSCDDNKTLAIRALNEKLQHDERISLSIVPIGDGLTLARKR